MFCLTAAGHHVVIVGDINTSHKVESMILYLQNIYNLFSPVSPILLLLPSVSQF